MDNLTSISLSQRMDSVVFCKDLQYIIPSVLSAISTAIVLIFSVSGKFWTRPLSSMIFAINAADFLYFMAKLSVLVYEPASDMTCIVMLAINVFGITLSASWTAIFGHGFYQTLKEGTPKILSSLLKYYIPISFVLPVLTGLMTFKTNNIHLLETGVCVYRVYIGQFDLFVFFHLQLPVTLAVALCILFYILSLLQLRKIINKIQVAEALTLMMYPAILVICWSPLIVIQVMAELGLSISYPAARMIRIISHLMGFFDALVYGEGMKGVLRSCLKTCNKKKRSKNSIDESRESTEEITDTLEQNTYMSFEEPKVLRNQNSISKKTNQNRKTLLRNSAGRKKDIISF